MSQKKLHTFFRIAPVVFLFLLALACEELVSDDPVEEHDDSFPVSGAVTLDIDSFNGRITVTGSDTNTVRVQARITRADRVDYEARQFGSSVQVSANQQGSTVGNSPSANIDITAPSSAVLVLQTSNGAIEVMNFTAGANLRTSNGRITVDGLEGDLEARTSNGTIVVTDHAGPVELETSNGGINYTGTLPPGTNNVMTSSNGSIRIDIEGEPSLVFDGSTSNGSVTSELQMTVDRSGDSYLEGVIGNGDSELTARTSNGSISVR